MLLPEFLRDLTDALKEIGDQQDVAIMVVVADKKFSPLEGVAYAINLGYGATMPGPWPALLRSAATAYESQHKDEKEEEHGETTN